MTAGRKCERLNSPLVEVVGEWSSCIFLAYPGTCASVPFRDLERFPAADMTHKYISLIINV